MKQIENLVFKGGGVKGIAYIGALQALQDNNMLTNIQRVAGTSAGAITATLVSLKYSPSDLYTILKKKNFSDFADIDGLVTGFKHLGMCKGDSFLLWMQQLIQQKGLRENATFRNFKENNCLDLHVFAVNITNNQLIEFSLDKTPDTVVAEAVRASMSIPLFFETWSFPGSTVNDLYVDGGVAYNYPINTFDNLQGNDKTLGCYLHNLNNIKNPLSEQMVANFIENIKAKADDHAKNGFFRNILGKIEQGTELAADEAIKGMWHLLTRSEAKHELMKEYLSMIESVISPPIGFVLKRDYYNYNRSVIIDDFGISAINFWLSDEDKDKLYQSGMKSTIEYIEKQ